MSPGSPEGVVTCAATLCDSKVRARGLCRKHYARLLRSGEMLPPIPRRSFWTHVNRAGAEDCWEWTGYITPDGYGQFGRNGRSHRIAYELTIGMIPDELEIDHLCRNRACVNPAHRTRDADSLS